MVVGLVRRAVHAVAILVEVAGFPARARCVPFDGRLGAVFLQAFGVSPVRGVQADRRFVAQREGQLSAANRALVGELLSQPEA